MIDAKELAREQRLDWLLAEALGGIGPNRSRPAQPRARTVRRQWQVAAAALLVLVVVLGVAALRYNESRSSSAETTSPQGESKWYQLNAPSDLDTLPAEAVSLRCYGFDDAGLAAVARITRIEQLDLGASGPDENGQRTPSRITDRGLASLAKLTRLRWLSLAFCEQVHGSGLAVLEDLPRLAYLDLTATGITDADVAAIGKLKLATLLLGGCAALTDDIGSALTGMVALRTLDLSALPKITADLLPQLPAGLVALALDRNHRLNGRGLQRLPELPQLMELGLDDVPAITDEELLAVLQHRALRVLRLGGDIPVRTNRGVSIPTDSKLTAAVGEILKQHTTLTSLGLSGHVTWLDANVMQAIATLPSLSELDFSNNYGVSGELLVPLATCHSLRILRLTRCIRVRGDAIDCLQDVALGELDLRGTQLPDAKIHEAARAWPGCLIVMPQGHHYRVPGK